MEDTSGLSIIVLIAIVAVISFFLGDMFATPSTPAFVPECKEYVIPMQDKEEATQFMVNMTLALGGRTSSMEQAKEQMLEIYGICVYTTYIHDKIYPKR